MLQAEPIISKLSVGQVSLEQMETGSKSVFLLILKLGSTALFRLGYTGELKTQN